VLSAYLDPHCLLRQDVVLYHHNGTDLVVVDRLRMGFNTELISIYVEGIGKLLGAHTVVLYLLA